METSWSSVRRCVLVALPFLSLSVFPYCAQSSEAIPPAITTPITVTSSAPVANGYADPALLSIPAISLNAPIKALGLNSKGEMDVPSGNSGNVGWYQYGTAPGNLGSAVVDAHVFAAFSNLHKLMPGSDIYVRTFTGQTLHFTVTQTRVYALAQVPSQQLFNRIDGRYLNLITCAGTFMPFAQTYDHRLVVYAKLVS